MKTRKKIGLKFGVRKHFGFGEKYGVGKFRDWKKMSSGKRLGLTNFEVIDFEVI